MNQVWLDRWEDGRIGWHEVDGSPLLRRYWPRLRRGSRVLVPLCGKSVDLLWLASQGMQVVGVEVSELGVRAFFDENDLDFRVEDDGTSKSFEAINAPLTVHCADYFAYGGARCDALFDRGSLVAVDPDDRDRYVEHTRELLKDDAFKLLITLEYDQSVVDGPPYSVSEQTVKDYWPDLRRVYSHNDIETGSPKFREAGLREVIETVWTSA